MWTGRSKEKGTKVIVIFFTCYKMTRVTEFKRLVVMYPIRKGARVMSQSHTNSCQLTLL